MEVKQDKEGGIVIKTEQTVPRIYYQIHIEKKLHSSIRHGVQENPEWASGLHSSSIFQLQKWIQFKYYEDPGDREVERDKVQTGVVTFQIMWSRHVPVSSWRQWPAWCSAAAGRGCGPTGWPVPVSRSACSCWSEQETKKVSTCPHTFDEQSESEQSVEGKRAQRSSRWGHLFVSDCKWQCNLRQEVLVGCQQL